MLLETPVVVRRNLLLKRFTALSVKQTFASAALSRREFPLCVQPRNVDPFAVGAEIHPMTLGAHRDAAGAGAKAELSGTAALIE